MSAGIYEKDKMKQFLKKEVHLSRKFAICLYRKYWEVLGKNKQTNKLTFFPF